MEPALIEKTLRRAVEHGGLRRESAALRRMLEPVSTPDFVGESAAIRAVLELAPKGCGERLQGEHPRRVRHSRPVSVSRPFGEPPSRHAAYAAVVTANVVRKPPSRFRRESC